MSSRAETYYSTSPNVDQLGRAQGKEEVECTAYYLNLSLRLVQAWSRLLFLIHEVLLRGPGGGVAVHIVPPGSRPSTCRC